MLRTTAVKEGGCWRCWWRSFCEYNDAFVIRAWIIAITLPLWSGWCKLKRGHFTRGNKSCQERSRQTEAFLIQSTYFHIHTRAWDGEEFWKIIISWLLMDHAVIRHYGFLPTHAAYIWNNTQKENLWPEFLARLYVSRNWRWNYCCVLSMCACPKLAPNSGTFHILYTVWLDGQV